MGSAKERLSERPEVAGHRPAVAGTCQKRSKSEVGAGARDVRGTLTGDFTDDTQRVAEVECHPAVAAIQREASAASRRQVRPHVVVVDAYIYQRTSLRQRGAGCHRGECESQQKKSNCPFTYER
jgi:hypothetical protein